MRIEAVSIEGFRCLDGFDLTFDPVTVFVGANGTGKSSVLHALQWFFHGGDLDLEDVSGRDAEKSIRVEVTFTDLSAADRSAFGTYAIGGSLTLWRIREANGDEKLTGRALAFSPFEAIRAHESAMDLRRGYGELRDQEPELELPSVGSVDQARAAMDEWEAAHPDDLEAAEISATHFFGFTGQPRLAGRFDYVLVPAQSDAAQETQDARGSLLRQLIDRTTGDTSRFDERMQELRHRMAEELGEIVRQEQEESLEHLSEAVTEELQVVVPSGAVEFTSVTPDLRLPEPGVRVLLDDGSFATTVARQGHGLQRSLIFALVKELSEVAGEGDPPALFLAIEEPELYQHPVQARHFAAVLNSLPRPGEGAIQVAYATHSEHFVIAENFEHLRRFDKQPGRDVHPVASVSHAALEKVVAGLDGVVAPGDVRRRVTMTLERSLSEAVFARAVLLVEGPSDRAVMEGVADRTGGFDKKGVAVVSAGGKGSLAVAWAILTGLGVPTLVLFDGDAGIEARQLAKGRPGDEAAADAAIAAHENRKLLRLFGTNEEDWPTTGVRGDFAVFGDRLETELEASWKAMLAEARMIADSEDEWREKPAECYRKAAAEVDGEVPQPFGEIVNAVLQLAGAP